MLVSGLREFNFSTQGSNIYERQRPSYFWGAQRVRSVGEELRCELRFRFSQAPISRLYFWTASKDVLSISVTVMFRKFQLLVNDPRSTSSETMMGSFPFERWKRAQFTIPRKCRGISSLDRISSLNFPCNFSHSSQSENISSEAWIRRDPAMGPLIVFVTWAFVLRSRYRMASLVFTLIASVPFFVLSSSSRTID